MPLHIDPAARAAFAPFYAFALAQTPPDVALLHAYSAARASNKGEAPTHVQTVALAQKKTAVPPQTLPNVCASQTLEQAAPQPYVLTLTAVEDAALAAHIAALPQPESITCVLVQHSAALKSLAPLEALANLVCVGVWDCPKLCALWCMDAQPLWGLALTDCKSLQSLAALAACADTLCHLFLQGRAWNTPRFQTLDPLAQLRALVTCDLALRKVSHSEKIYFDTCFPRLRALTITPNLSKYFKRVND